MKLKINKEGKDVFEVFGLTQEELQDLALRIRKVLADNAFLDFAELIDEFAQIFDDDTKTAFTLFTLGRVIGSEETMHQLSQFAVLVAGRDIDDADDGLQILQ